MKISFVIPAYNEEADIGPCLESVQKEIIRERADAEIIVVNNASTDRTADIARGFRNVRVVEEPRKGLVRARQAGFKVSTGELVANVDADTMVPQGWLHTVLQEFERDKKLVALSGPFIYHDLPLFSRILVRVFYAAGYLMYFLNRFVFRIGSMLQGGNFVARREALQKIGGFNTSIEFYGEDTDVARRLSKIGNVKWSFKLPIYTSGRRLTREGIISVGLRYALNFFWTTFFGKPYTLAYKDIRPEK
ncbi:glycosyltransferase family 2 protein [Candidatus Kaiserbacteria bacterium]|nr:glycosyltransferase family 2 protein [Candidatus Kaiserbacteria bacterium]